MNRLFKDRPWKRWTLVLGVLLFLGISAGIASSPMVLELIFDDAQIAVDKLEPAASEKVLVANASAQAEWSSELEISNLQLDPAPVDISGTVASMEGSVLTGNGTQFTAELEAGDTLLIGGSPVEVDKVLSDTAVVMKDYSVPKKTGASDPSPVMIHKHFFFDQRDADSTTLNAKVGLPKYGNEYRAVVVFAVGRGAARPDLTITVNGKTATGTETGHTNTHLLSRNFYGSQHFPEGVDEAEIQLTSSIAARLSLVVFTLTGVTIQSLTGQSSSAASLVLNMQRTISSHELVIHFGVINASVMVQPTRDGAFLPSMPCPTPMILKALGANDYTIVVALPRADTYGTSVCSYDMTAGGPATSAYISHHYEGDGTIPLQRLHGHLPD
jgi:hypothetical protein